MSVAELQARRPAAHPVEALIHIHTNVVFQRSERTMTVQFPEQIVNKDGKDILPRWRGFSRASASSRRMGI
jgi:hypothetical protein